MGLDIMIATVPKLQLRSPIIGPAILKSVAQDAGFTCLTVDWNLDLWHSHLGRKYPEWWYDTDLVFRYEANFKKKFEEMKPLVKKWVDQVEELSPRWLGLCIFSQRSKFMTIEICKELKSRNLETKIVVGGPFVHYCGNNFLNRGYVDAYIEGEGEHALVALLKGEDHGGVNGFAPQIDDLDQIPIPDYSDCDFSLYPKRYEQPEIYDPKKMGSDILYITGSRGCVRRCSFCDVGFQWKKFRYRSGKSIAEEMLTQHRTHGIRRFYFTDSLLNGSVPILKELCETLIETYKRENMKKLRWQGQFICRPKKSMPPEIFDLMAEAGYEYVSMGVESISEKVRNDMKKHFSNEDLLYTLEQCHRTGVTVSMLMMVGFPTETESDFQETLKFFEENQRYRDSGTIRTVTLGPTCEIVKGSPLYFDVDKLGIHFDEMGHWVYKDNNMKTRIDRYIRFHNLMKNLNYDLTAKTVAHLEEELIQIQELEKLSS